MHTKVLVKVRTARVSPSFPRKCVYCCRPAEKRVPQKIGQSSIRLGKYNSQLAEKHNLPRINERPYGGFEVHAYAGGSGQQRTWSIQWQFNAEVPYCADHFTLQERIVRASDPGKWYLLMIPCAALAASLAAYGVIQLPDTPSGWISPNTLFIGTAGFFAGAGLGFLAHKTFDPPAPAEKRDFLKPPFFSVAGVGGFGYQFMIEHKRSLVEFLDDPYITICCHFVNHSYAREFAELNSGEMD